MRLQRDQCLSKAQWCPVQDPQNQRRMTAVANSRRTVVAAVLALVTVLDWWWQR